MAKCVECFSIFRDSQEEKLTFWLISEKAQSAKKLILKSFFVSNFCFQGDNEWGILDRWDASSLERGEELQHVRTRWSSSLRLRLARLVRMGKFSFSTSAQLVEKFQRVINSLKSSLRVNAKRSACTISIAKVSRFEYFIVGSFSFHNPTATKVYSRP